MTAKRYETFKVDRRLDNRREPISATLLRLSFRYGDAKIKVERKRYKARSGYCLDSAANELSLSISDIGKVQNWQGSNSGELWEIFTYVEEKAQAACLLLEAITKRKRELQRQADRLKIPSAPAVSLK